MKFPFDRSPSKSRSTASRALACALGAAVMLVPMSAQAKDSTGKVSSIMIDQTNYMALRIKLHGVSSFCDGGAQNQHVAYMSKDHALYETVLRLVSGAYLAGKRITIRANKDGTFCRIYGLKMED